MHRDLKKEPLRGVIPPMATLLLDDNQLDKEGTAQLIEHLIAGGVHGIFILGTTGECTNISYQLRRELITLSCEKVNGRVPVLVGITEKVS